MRVPARRIFAPTLAAAFVVLAIAADLWRGDPPPLTPAPVHEPAVAPAQPFVLEQPVRNPFRAHHKKEQRAAPAPAPAPSATAAPLPPPRLPSFSGVIERDGRRYVLAPDGLVPEGGMLGEWKLVSIGKDEVIFEASGVRTEMTPVGQVISR